jgi:hypothetical protein
MVCFWTLNRSSHAIERKQLTDCLIGWICCLIVFAGSYFTLGCVFRLAPVETGRNLSASFIIILALFNIHDVFLFAVAMRLQIGYDIRIVQESPGRWDVSTTMIYARILNWCQWGGSTLERFCTLRGTWKAQLSLNGHRRSRPR